MSAVLGRTIRIEQDSIAAREARPAAAGMDEYGRAALAAMFRYYAEHGLPGNPAALHRLLGRAPNDLRQCLAALDRPWTR
jgi:hypothetical protein